MIFEMLPIYVRTELLAGEFHGRIFVNEYPAEDRDLGTVQLQPTHPNPDKTCTVQLYDTENAHQATDPVKDSHTAVLA